MSAGPIALTAGGVLSSLEAAADRLTMLDPRLVAAALTLQLGIVAFRALAWRNVLSAAYPAERVSLAGVGAAYAVGVALNGLVPARGGEAAKIGLVRLQLPHSSVPTIAASALVILLLDAALGLVLLSVAVATGGVASLPRLPGSDAVLELAGEHRPAAAVAVGAIVTLSYVACRRFRPRFTGFLTQVRQGVAVLRTPGRYVRMVALPQLGAWLCRVGVVLSLLAAFDMPATLPVALLVIALGGVSTMVPGAPGGLGAQQLLLVYALRETASAATVLSFSIGMQAGVTVMNTLVGLAAAMLVFRTYRPVAAIRASLAIARPRAHRRSRQQRRDV